MSRKKIHLRYKSIHDAVKKADVQALAAMVKVGQLMEEVDNSRHGFTPMHWACRVGAVECLHWLLWHGAQCEVRNQRGYTPMHVGAIHGQFTCLEALIDNGAEVNALDMRCRTPAHMAVSHGHSFTLLLLLKRGAEVHAVDGHGWTLIHCCVFHGRLDCLQLVCKMGGDIDDIDCSGNTPAHLAAMEGQLECLKFIVQCSKKPGGTVAARNNDGNTPLMIAQRFCKQNIIDYLKQLDSTVANNDDNLPFPGHKAAYTGDMVELRTLLQDRTVHMNDVDVTGSTMLHKAAGQGHLAVVKYLLDMGVDTKLMNQAGDIAYHVAQRYAHLAVMKAIGDADAEAEDARRQEHMTSACGIRNKDSKVQAPVVSSKYIQHQAMDNARLEMLRLEKMVEIAWKNCLQFGEDPSTRPEYGYITAASAVSYEDDGMMQVQMDELHEMFEDEKKKREALEALLDERAREVCILSLRLHRASRRRSTLLQSHSGRGRQQVCHNVTAIRVRDPRLNVN